MDTILGLVGMVVWIAAVIALAAGVTFAVIKLSPGGRAANGSAKPAEPAP
jgi:hypothetical protein